MTEAERITKYWTDVYSNDQYRLCLRRCVKQEYNFLEKEDIIITFSDRSQITFLKTKKWKMLK